MGDPTTHYIAVTYFACLVDQLVALVKGQEGYVNVYRRCLVETQPGVVGHDLLNKFSSVMNLVFSLPQMLPILANRIYKSRIIFKTQKTCARKHIT